MYTNVTECDRSQMHKPQLIRDGDALRVAGTAEFCGDDDVLPDERIEYLLTLTEQVMADFAATMDRTTISPFAGSRPLSTDGTPLHRQV